MARPITFLINIVMASHYQYNSAELQYRRKQDIREHFMSFSNELINADQLVGYESLELQALPKQSMIVSTMVWLITLGISFIVMSILYFVLNVPIFRGGVLYWMLGYLVVFALGCLLIKVAHKHKGYAIREHDITYKSGIFWQKQIVLPFNRIQHVETHQGVLQRKYELAKLQLFTAGGIRADLTINGINYGVAQGIKSRILNRLENEKLNA